MGVIVAVLTWIWTPSVPSLGAEANHRHMLSSSTRTWSLSNQSSSQSLFPNGITSTSTRITSTRITSTSQYSNIITSTASSICRYSKRITSTSTSRYSNRITSIASSVCRVYLPVLSGRKVVHSSHKSLPLLQHHDNNGLLECKYNFTLFDQLDALCCNCVPFEEPDIKHDNKKLSELSMTKRETIWETWSDLAHKSGWRGQEWGRRRPRSAETSLRPRSASPASPAGPPRACWTAAAQGSGRGVWQWEAFLQSARRWTAWSQNTPGFQDNGGERWQRLLCGSSPCLTSAHDVSPGWRHSYSPSSSILLFFHVFPHFFGQVFPKRIYAPETKQVCVRKQACTPGDRWRWARRSQRSRWACRQTCAAARLCLCTSVHSREPGYMRCMAGGSAGCWSNGGNSDRRPVVGVYRSCPN